jgi:hypothetical protein
MFWKVFFCVGLFNAHAFGGLLAVQCTYVIEQIFSHGWSCGDRMAFVSKLTGARRGLMLDGDPQSLVLQT